MATLSKITLPNNQTYDLKDGTKTGIYFVNGTQTAATGSWKGEIDVPELYDGLTIAYHLPYSGSGNASLQLTLSDGTTSANLPVYYTGTTRCTTHYTAGSTIILTYVSAESSPAFTTDRWTSADYNANDPQYRNSLYYNKATVATACGRYMLLLSISSEELLPMNAVDNNTTTTKTLTTESFNPYLPIYYYYSTTVLAANGVPGNNTIFDEYEAISLKYATNVGETLTANKPVYLVVVPQSDGMVKLASDPIAQVLPSSEDGKYYIFLGYSYSTYQMNLFPEHPIYQYKGGSIKLVNSSVSYWEYNSSSDTVDLVFPN